MSRAVIAEALPPAAQAGVTQAGASVLAILPVVAGLEVTLAQWAVVQGAIALRIATFAGAARWWLPLHLAFVPGLVWASGLQIPAIAWGIAFVILAATYGGTMRTQVPLFLTGRSVRARLAELLELERHGTNLSSLPPFTGEGQDGGNARLPPPQPSPASGGGVLDFFPRAARRGRVDCGLKVVPLEPGCSLRFIDLGCGLGGVIAALKRARPECEFHGVELAPLPYWVSRWRARRAGCKVARRDLMTVDLSAFDVVYAFLSPAPMPALWAKAKREMRSGTLFVSLAFPVPDERAHEVVPVSGRARHTLYVWRM